MKQVVVALSRIPARWEDKYWTGMQLVKFFFSFIVSWSSGDIWEIWATCCLLKGDSRVFCAGRTYLSFAPMIILMSSAFREDRASSLLVGQNPCVSKQSCSECMQVRRTESKQAKNKQAKNNNLNMPPYVLLKWNQFGRKSCKYPQTLSKRLQRLIKFMGFTLSSDE